MYVFLPFLVVLSRLQNKERGHSYEQLDETLKDGKIDNKKSISIQGCSALYSNPSHWNVGSFEKEDTMIERSHPGLSVSCWESLKV